MSITLDACPHCQKPVRDADGQHCLVGIVHRDRLLHFECPFCEKALTLAEVGFRRKDGFRDLNIAIIDNDGEEDVP